MSRYVLIRRLRGPAFLLLVGVNALLAQANILGWEQSWPFYLILAGVLLLAERAVLAAEGYPGASWRGGWPQPGAGAYTCASASAAQSAAQPAAGQSAAAPAAAATTTNAPTRWQEFENGKEGDVS